MGPSNLLSFRRQFVPVQVVPCDAVGKFLIRGCSARLSGKDTLCQAHAAARDAQVQPMYAEIEAHRLVRALHAPDDVQFLEIKLQDFRGWQPSCAIPEENLQQYFAKKADERIRLRRYRAQTHRNQRKISAKPMRPKTFLSSWSSVSPKQASSCATHKESDKDVVAAARTAGFLFAISHSGLVVHLEELIGAESLSQRTCCSSFQIYRQWCMMTVATCISWLNPKRLEQSLRRRHQSLASSSMLSILPVT